MQVIIPELALWRRALAALSLLILSLVGVGSLLGAPPSQAFHDFNHRRLQEFRVRHDGKPGPVLRVVMLGNSRLKNATVDDALLQRLAAERGLERIETFRLVANWAVFRDFEPLLDEIEALDPDLYIIQLDLLADEMTAAWRAEQTYYYVRWLANGAGAWTRFKPEEEQLERVCAGGQFLDMRTVLANLKLRTDTEADSPRLARKFIAEVAERAESVLIVSVPKSPELEARLPSANPEALAAVRALQSRYGSIDLAVFPHTLPDDHFCDVTHLGVRGTEVYSRWLMEQMASRQGSIGP